MSFRTLLLFSAALFMTGVLSAQDAAPKLNFSICSSSYEPDSGWQRVQICMAATEGNTYHSRGQVYLNVDGGNLAGIAESEIIVRPLALLNQSVEGLPMPRYETINSVNTGNSVVITWVAKNLGQPGNPKLHTEVPAEPAGLYEILIPAKEPMVFSLDPNLMRGQTFFITEGDKMEKAYAEGEF
jgi:hypothetical protein